MAKNSIFVTTLFFILLKVSIFVIITPFCSSTTPDCNSRVSNTYCLNSTLPSTWYNNNSVIMDGWQMRVFLVLQGKSNPKNVGLYGGFYCAKPCNNNSYLLSVIAFNPSVKNNHSLVWSANRDHPVGPNARLELTGQGLELRDSNGLSVWSSNRSSNDPIVGMSLSQEGNLALFNNESSTVWKSPADNSSFSSLIPSTPPSSKGNNTTGPIVQPSPSPGSKRKRKNSAAIIAGPAAAGGGVFVIFLLVVWFRRRKNNDKEQDEVEDYMSKVPGMPVRFSYEDLHVATEHFKERLGGGGFGSVFKGQLPDGTKIAVKRLDQLGQGVREFLAEVESIGSLHHFNLVRLIGYCAEKSLRLLVYEYMSNGSLDNWIFSKDKKKLCLDWQARKKIILDIAKGLAYLHEDCRQTIIHLDIKPQNILLDDNFNAKVSDFGLSKLIDRDESQVLTTMRGTPGYLAPEWRQLRITVKVDIYSFGIVVLETVCLRKNLDRFQSESSLHLLRMLQEKAEEGRLIEIVGNLDEETLEYREEVERMIRVAAWCLQDDHKQRPLMSTVVKVLEGVMEVDPKISYQFANAMVFPKVVHNQQSVNEIISDPPQPSILSTPR